MNVVQLSAPQFQNLYKWLEVDFNPLNLCNNVQSVIDFIGTDENNPLIQYTESLHDVTLVRLVRQISQVYQSIEFKRFLELAKFANTYKLERILVDCVRHNDMQITIDHKLKCVHFGTDLSESQREYHPDGPTLQSMPSEQVRSQLVNMSIVLHRAIAAINPNRKKAEREKLRAAMVQNYHDNKVKEHQNILIRQKLIEDRKEYIERMNNEREEEENRRQEELHRQHKIAEQKRLEQEMEERERKRAESELMKIKTDTASKRIKEISQMSHGHQLLKIIEEKGTIDPDDIAREEQNALIKERKELQTKLKSQEKKIDYFERAKRAEEIPLIDKYLDEKAVQDKVFWENQEKTRIENAISERENAVAQQDRLKRMYPDRDAFLDQLKAERKSLFVEKLKRFNDTLEEERRRRLEKRAIERREIRRKKWLQEKEEEKQRKLEDQRRAQEEKDRTERERRAKEAAEKQEELRLLTEKRLQREEEATKKMREDREKMAREKDGFPARGGGGGEKSEPDRGGWRRPGAGGGAAPASDTKSAAATAADNNNEWRMTRGGDRDRVDRPERERGERQERMDRDREERDRPVKTERVTLDKERTERERIERNEREYQPAPLPKENVWRSKTVEVGEASEWRKDEPVKRGDRAAERERGEDREERDGAAHSGRYEPPMRRTMGGGDRDRERDGGQMRRSGDDGGARDRYEPRRGDRDDRDRGRFRQGG